MAKRGFLARSWRVLLGLAITVILLRIAAPFVVLHFVNQKLANLNGYYGQVVDVDLAIYRGAYQLEGLTIIKRGKDFPEPLLRVPVMDISVLWSAIFRGDLVAELIISSPRVHLVDDPDAENDTGGDQLGLTVPWQKLFDMLTPTHFERLEVRDAAVHFHNYKAEPEIDVFVNGVGGEAYRVLEENDATPQLPGRIRLQGEILEHAKFELTGRFAADVEEPNFKLSLTENGLDLSLLRNLLKEYAPLDLESGNLDLSAEIEAKNSQVNGYLKPVLTDLEIVSWEGDVQQDGDSLLRLFVESIGGVFAEIFEHQPKDKFATVIPIKGDLNEPNVNKWVAFKNLLTNMFTGKPGERLMRRVLRPDEQADDAESAGDASTEARAVSNYRNAGNSNSASGDESGERAEDISSRANGPAGATDDKFIGGPRGKGR